MPTKVISFGCKPPRENAALIGEQISLAHKYYNRMIELHRERIAACEQARLALFPDYAAIEEQSKEAEEEVERIAESIRKENARAKRKRATPEESQRLADAKAKRKAIWARRKEIRQGISSDIGLQSRLAEINAEYNGTIPEGRESNRRAGGKLKDARANCGVYPGTYLRYEAAVEAAMKKTIGPPNFQRWDGSGQVAVQIKEDDHKPTRWQDIVLQRGSVARLVQARPLPTTQTSAKRARRWEFRLRIQSDNKRGPIWATVMAYVQADRIPDDAEIKWAALVRKPLPPHRMSDGTWQARYDWSLQFTIRTSEVKPRATSGACGIDLGWRLVPDGLRVAYLVGDDGHREELILPTRLLNRWSKSESIQGIRDKAFDAAKVKLIEWKQSQETLPEWFTEQAKTVSQWKGKGKLAYLIKLWAGQRIAGDDEIFAYLFAWREHDVHLWQYEFENERKAQRIRLNLYREFASKVAARYKTVIVEDCDWRQMARKPKADDNTAEAGMKAYMRIASVGKIRELLKQDGAIMSDAKDTTKLCHACGSLEEFDHRELMHTCNKCNLPWDQDYNAAMNLLASGLVPKETPDSLADGQGVVDQPVTATEAKYVGRWAKKKLERSQKATQEKVVE